jgi:hypothetical protein
VFRVEDDIAHRRSGRFGTTRGMGERDELVQLSIGVEDTLTGQIRHRRDRTQTPAPYLLVQRPVAANTALMG